MKKIAKLVTMLLLVTLFSVLPSWAANGAENPWPREIATSQGVVVIYQPQPEKLDGDQLTGQIAVSVELKDAAGPVFGAVWFKARLETDRSTRTATIAGITVTQVRFPEQDEKKQARLRELLEKESPNWQLPISIDRLMATLEMTEKRSKSSERINTDPPKIIFMSEPAVLIILDGEPQLKDEEGTDVKRVMNSPFTILFNPADKTYYLYADEDAWYKATDIMGEWAVAKKVPSEIAKRALEIEPDSETEEPVEPEDDDETGPPPKVVVVTEPAELISSQGKPAFAPISGTDLLYVSNTDSDVLMNIKTQQYFVLLAGRWYRSKKLEGPWKYVPAEKVPADFAKIPEESEMGTVLYAVPGTDAAKDAVLDAQIPQTAAVDRKKAKLTVEYDGSPKFEKIEKTKMTYAVNTATPVILASKKYYACDVAVWFVADKATGPWQLATHVPDVIYTIPPNSPMYHLTFVRIYRVTEDYVYVGYTQGYTHTYIYHNTIVYGTGYSYPGWYGRYYYPRPATWGFHVRYNPWTGWRFGLSYSNGPFTFTIGGGGWYRGGWWGPGRYRSYRRGYRHGSRRGARAGYRAGYRAGQRQSAQQNLYRSQRNQNRTKPSPPVSVNNPGTTGNKRERANNVYTDRNGDIHRKTDRGWEKRGQDGWQSETGPSSRDREQMDNQRQPQQQKKRPSKAQPQQSQQRQTQQLDRAHQSRQHGNQRTRSFSQSQRSGNRSGNRSGGRTGGRSGGRSGGGRR